MKGESYFTIQEVFLWLNVDNVREAGRSPVSSATDPASTDQARATARIAEALELRLARCAAVAAK